jgi:hypothetical protein
MPRNYQNTVIYKIVCNDLNIKDLYIGSTVNFKNRKSHHKLSCYYESNNYSYNYKIYKIIRDNGGWDNWTMLEVEKYPCNDNNEARARERYWFEQLQATMNVALPIIDAEDTKKYMKDYNIKNQEHIKELKKIYSEKNKEQNIEYRKKYYQENKEKRCTEEYKKKCKESQQKNKEKKNATRKQWRLNNIIICDCGSKFNPDGKTSHLKSTKHQDFINKTK